MIPASKSPLLEKWFCAYTLRYLSRHFHAVRLVGEVPRLPEGESLPLLVCLNHSSWWDVLLGLRMAMEFKDWEWYGVMDERQLRRYRFFARLGMIGVDREHLQGAREFLDYANGLLEGQARALWLTPQGAMLSNYARPIRFQPGVAQIAGALSECYVTTVAFHYEFWDERLPEAFVSLSPLKRVSQLEALSRRGFTKELEERMETQLDALLEKVRLRDAAEFTTLLRGKAGISATYDAIRTFEAKRKGEKFSAEHGTKVTPAWRERPDNKNQGKREE